MKRLTNQNHSKWEEQNGLWNLPWLNKLWLWKNLQDNKIALEEDRSTPGSEKLWLWIKTWVMQVGTGRNILALDTGRCRLFEHMRDQGEQVETLWESGKTIRHLTREEGQDTWNESGKLVIFKIKQEMTRQDKKQNVNRDIYRKKIQRMGNCSSCSA